MIPSHPWQISQLYGHKRAFETLLRVHVQEEQGGTAPHAWLISGPKGIGKASLAFTFAPHFLSTVSEPVNSARQRIAHRAHPHLFYLAPDFESPGEPPPGIQSIKIDWVRELSRFARLTPEKADQKRLVIVDRVDLMTLGAANALLKLLEEPPVNLLFLLLIQDQRRLLPTLASRSAKLALSPLDSHELSSFLHSLGIEVPASEKLVLSKGRPGLALALFSPEGELLESYMKIVGAMTPAARPNWPSLLPLLRALSSRERQEESRLLFDLLVGRLSSHFVASKSVEKIAFASPQEGRWLQSFPQTYSLYQTRRFVDLLARFESCQRDQQDYNLDRFQFFIDRIRELSAFAGQHSS